jgi:capsular polysaccharide transport system permease protein
MNKLHPILDMKAEPVDETLPEVAKPVPAAKAKPLRPVPQEVPDDDGDVRAPARAKPARPAAKRDGFPLADAQAPDIAGLPRKGRRKRSVGLWASFLLMVAVPTLAAGLYYGLVVSNQYMSEFRFAVRSQDFAPAGTTSASTALGAAARGMGIFTDNFLVIDYLTSRQAVEDLMKTVDLREMYTRGGVDYLSRLRGEETMENLVTYWQSMIDANFDLATGLALVRVRAFTAEDAHKIAATLVTQSERLINEISARARRDAVKFAENDVSRAEERLRGARAALRQFRDIQQTPDATRTAGGTLDLTMKLRGELAGLQSQLASLRTYMNPDAPTVKVLESRIAATQKQIASIEGEMGKGGQVGGQPNGSQVGGAQSKEAPAAGAATAAAVAANPVLSDILANYEDVDLSRQFAEKYYDTTLSALELARSEAAAQQTYVATYVQPALAQASEYPRRVISTLIVFLAAGALWFISVMVFFSIRDHVA